MTTVSTEVEQVDGELAKKQKVMSLVTGFASKFASVLPAHMKSQGNGGEMFSALAIMALRDNPKVAQAAMNDPQKLLAALIRCARLGHYPGTEAFYLVPVSPRRGEPRVIEGWEGYQGLVERMHRAGGMAALITQVVRAGDIYHFEEGMKHPRWSKPKKFATDEERGDRIGVYGYARMLGLNGGQEYLSQTVEMSPDVIERRRKLNAYSDDPKSPWKLWTDSMWRKCVAFEIGKWIPTSPDYRYHLAASAQKMQEIAKEEGLPEPDEAFVEGELVDVEWPETAQVPTTTEV